MPRPLLFLGVDGPLIPFGGVPSRASDGPADLADANANPLLARLNPDHGRRLLRLACDLVWATTWMTDANDEIAPRLGLPRLPVVDWPDDDGPSNPRLHWKTRALVAWADGRALSGSMTRSPPRIGPGSQPIILGERSCIESTTATASATPTSPQSNSGWKSCNAWPPPAAPPRRDTRRLSAVVAAVGSV